MKWENYYLLLEEPKVKEQVLKEKPILKFDDFEFKDIEYYPPILLRILINSINIFNKIWDAQKEQINDFPIGIQIIKGERGRHLILYTINKADILTELVNEKEQLFDDLSTNIVKKIDIDLEKEKNPNEFTHSKFFNGFNYERNCINHLIKIVGENNIKILPNLYFYIDEKKKLSIANKLGLKFPEQITEIENKIDNKTDIKSYYGYSEADLFIEFKKDIKFTELKDLDLIISYPKNDYFYSSNRYIFDMKINSKEVNIQTINGLKRKGNELQEALFNQKFIIEKKTIYPVIIMDQNLKVCQKTFKNINFNNDDIIIGFYGDISINYTTISNLVLLIEENKKITKEVKRDLEVTEEKINKLINEKKEEKEEKDKLNKNIDNLTKELNETKRDLEVSEEKINKLINEKKEEKEEKDKLNKNIDNLTKELNELKSNFNLNLIEATKQSVNEYFK